MGSRGDSRIVLWRYVRLVMAFHIAATIAPVAHGLCLTGIVLSGAMFPRWSRLFLDIQCRGT